MQQEQQNKVFKALADPTRRQILEKLLTDHPLGIHSLADGFQSSRQAVSKHLNILEEAGLVRLQKQGRETLCYPLPGPLAAVKDWIIYFEQYWNKLADRLEDYAKKQQE